LRERSKQQNTHTKKKYITFGEDAREKKEKEKKHTYFAATQKKIIINTKLRSIKVLHALGKKPKENLLFSTPLPIFLSPSTKKHHCAPERKIISNPLTLYLYYRFAFLILKKNEFF
jgi:hypothetical protein